jgi:hypothetical protein
MGLARLVAHQRTLTISAFIDFHRPAPAAGGCDVGRLLTSLLRDVDVEFIDTN